MAKDNDFFDVIFDVIGEQIRGVWLLLMYLNKIFREDYMNNPRKVYEVDKRVSRFGFKTLLKFYGFDSVLINNDNIYEIITSSIVFEENRLLEHCKNYICKYNNQEMCLKLIKNIHLFKGSTLYKSFLDKLIPVLRLYGNYYFEPNVLKTSSIDAVEYLLKMPDLVVSSESFVYESIAKYFVHHYTNILEDNKYFHSKFASFSSLIQWPNIDKSMKERIKIPFLEENHDPTSLKGRRRYFYLSSTSVAHLALRNLIIKYSTCDEYLLELSKEEKDTLPDNLETYWNEIFKTDEIKAKLTMMIIMIDCKCFHYSIYLYLFNY